MNSKVQKLIIGLIIVLVIAFIGLIYYIMIEFYSEEKSKIESPLSTEFYEVYEPLNLNKYSILSENSEVSLELRKNFTKNLIFSYNLDKFINIDKSKSLDEQYPLIVDNVINCVIYDKSIENLEATNSTQKYKNVVYTLAISRTNFNEIVKELMDIDLNDPIKINEENNLYKRIKYNKANDEYLLNTGNLDLGEQPPLIYSLNNIKKNGEWYEAEIYAYNIVEETDNNTEYTLNSIINGKDKDLLDKAFTYNKNMINQFIKVEFKEINNGKHVKYTINKLSSYKPVFEMEKLTLNTEIIDNEGKYYIEMPENITVISKEYNVSYYNENHKVKLNASKIDVSEKKITIEGSFEYMNNEIMFKTSN